MTTHTQTHECECSDPGCPMAHGSACHRKPCCTLYRVDMEDRTGTRFCEDCADDAWGSGVFTNTKPARGVRA